MSIDNIIIKLKSEIKKLCKEYANTPTSNPDADLLLGIIKVHKAEFLEMLERKEQLKAQRERLTLVERVTHI